MKNLVTSIYRKDIDGIRAIAVLSVIFFHLGLLPNGYLGVDVFFVISGYLIIKIIHSEVNENHFSIINFYIRRIRRIIPLVLFTSLIALITGYIVMLPDDFENLCQSVFATNFFSNNVLLYLTTDSYWDIVNDYKPLMHTWSLGIEEQFYIILPLIFVFFNSKKIKYSFYFLIILSIISLVLFCFNDNIALTFYMLPFRFFELAVGGIGAIFFNQKKINNKLGVLLLFLLIAILISVNINIHPKVFLLLTVIITTGLLVSNKNPHKIISFLLENQIVVVIGKISFSLYMWHQILLAFARYFLVEKILTTHILIFLFILFTISILSYYFIEQFFRDKNKINTKKLILLVGSVFILISCLSFYGYKIGGIVRDVPELGLKKSDIRKNNGSVKRNIHIEYNAKIYDLDKNFSDKSKIHVLIIGNSFARDFANILLESEVGQKIEISYVFDINNCPDIDERIKFASYIFFSELDMKEYIGYRNKFKIKTDKVWNIGTKNFGTNNGIFYNKKRDSNYCNQHTKIDLKYINKNNLLKEQWGKKYIDLINAIIDKENTVPVFSNECQFISQDCKHLTKAGAIYFSNKIEINKIFKINNFGN